MAKEVEVRRFRNTSTGLVEKVTHPQTIELMEGSDRYEEVKAKSEKPAAKAPAKPAKGGDKK